MRGHSGEGGIDDWVESRKEQMLDELGAWLRIPSVSTDPEREGDCRRAARWLAEHLRSLGCHSVELVGDENHPVVHAEGPTSPGRPTILVYGHYDVQPPDPLEEWRSPPFEPTIRDGNLYARGATDDKGQLFAIVKAFQASTTGEAEPAVNVRFLVEGQEESGGHVLLNLVGDRPELIQADVVLVADGPFYAPGWPVIEVGVRGLCYAEIVVRTLDGDLHSGLYGGVAPNALEALVRILSALKTEGGRIRVPGLYEALSRPSASERASWKRLPFDGEVFRREEVGARRLVGERRYSILERIWARPTLELHGISGGFTGDGLKTVIPAEASAKVSLRLVPDQKASAVFQQLDEAVREVAPEHAEVEVRALGGADPVLIDVGHEAFGILGRAFREVFGRAPVHTRSGGSLPILGALGRSGAAVALAGIGLPDDRPHAPNEKFEVTQFTEGVRAFARFFQSWDSSNGKEK